MATPLDVGLLQTVKIIFPFLMVLFFVFAGLTRFKFFQEKKVFAAIIAFALAVITLTSPIAVKSITLMAPWFVIFVIFGMLLIAAYQSFGVESETITEIITGEEYGKTFAMWVLSIMLIIGIGSVLTVVGQVPGPGVQGQPDGAAQPQGAQEVQQINQSGQGGQRSAFWQTIFHPKVLGLALILLIAYFTVGALTKKE